MDMPQSIRFSVGTADVRPAAARRAFGRARGGAAPAPRPHPLEYQMYYGV